MSARVWAGFLAAAGLWAQTPPDRVGRVSFLYGSVSYRPAQTQDWGDATLNLPLSNGDHVWTDLNAQAEVRESALAVHLAPQTAISVVGIDDQSFRIAVTEGAINFRIGRMNEGDIVEVTTPAGAIRLLSPGTYRFDVVPAGSYVTVAVRSGAAQATSGPQVVAIQAGQRLMLTGSPAVLEFLDVPPLDAWDEWCADRDAAFERDLEASDAYVSWEVPGVEDLASNGEWETDSELGVCWTPNTPGWTPFQHGHWIYKARWGWTWVDDAAWAFAPSHYGRWAKIKQGWAWIPGRNHRKEPYSPATVAFAPGTNRVAWAPLGPAQRDNRDSARSADLTAFRTARPVAAGRTEDGIAVFTPRQPAVEPTPEALVGGIVHRAKPDAEARVVATAPAMISVPAATRTEPVENHRSDPAPAPAQAAAPAAEEPRHSSASTHSEEPRRSDPDPPRHDPDPPQHSEPPHSAPASPPPQHTVESHPVVQEHRVEAPHATPPSSRSDSSSSNGGHRK